MSKISFRSYLIFLFLPTLLIIIHHHHHHRRNNNDNDNDDDNASTDLSLSTNSRWIVDDRNNGERVKLSCVSWVSHLEVAVAEGLSKQPVDAISKMIVEMGFNCVRLTYPLFLFTDDKLGSMTMRQSLQKWGLFGTVAGVQVNNPSLVDLSLVNVFQEIVSNLNNNNVMVILDNHLSKPGWCCNENDDDGFFGDLYFDPEVWIEGICRVASMFKGYTNVVGMSLRNELRGHKQNLNDWYKYMQKGAERVHAANPNVLVILSGLNYDLDLSFLRTNPISVSFSRKLVFEIHWYGFSDGDDWITGNLNEVCGRVIDRLTSNALFLLDQGYPLFMSEWGVDQTGTNENDNRYLNCLMGWAAEHDIDWALWTIVGSYYYREGVSGWDETYGLLNWDWRGPRSSSFLKKISPLQSPFQALGSSSTSEHKILFHPSTGLCMHNHSLSLGPCSNAMALDYTLEKTLILKGTNYCLQANALHKPVKLDTACHADSSSKWEAISASKMHLSSKTKNDTIVCLDIDTNNIIVTNICKCLSREYLCDPSSQWFKIINSTSFNLAPPIIDLINVQHNSYLL
ncbi:hypothetical protein QVD17_31536 [Tagetes erecta]|uniref:Glycoside hydrolase family 5 domain-containing protein n=1 Tax=Tagetes erecta TaxID=13708 RepID=A0AAD8K9Z4_TARER|nr:hypothetical protein QVD17_31536 [Tagetes erecta]